MRWIEPGAEVSLPPGAQISLLRRAIEKQPNNPALYLRLGAALANCGLFGEAVDAYETAARQAPDEFVAGSKLAKCYVELDRPEAALDACRHGEARGASAELHFQRGPRAGQIAACSPMRGDAFWSAVKANGTHIPALRALLAPMAREPDGAELLDFCDALPQSSKDTALVRAHRAIALSPNRPESRRRCRSSIWTATSPASHSSRLRNSAQSTNSTGNLPTISLPIDLRQSLRTRVSITIRAAVSPQPRLSSRCANS